MMGWFRSIGASVLAFWSVLVCCEHGSWDGSLDLHCGFENLQFSIPSGFVLRAVDHKAKTRILRNSSACGTWVEKKRETVKVVASYDGCYVRVKNELLVMTISLEETINGKVQHHKKELKCPIMPVMDAPAPSECAAVARQERLSCATPVTSRSTCEGLGCCFAPEDSAIACYFGKPLTAQCANNSRVTIAVSADLTKPPLNMDSVHAINVSPASCPGMTVTSSKSFTVLHFPLSCGQMGQTHDGAVTYENTIEATQDVRTWNRASITRDSTMRITIRCTYSMTGIAPLLVQVSTLPPPLPVSTTGPLLLEMRIAQDQQYSAYYADSDYPVQKVLRDPVYLEVRILQRTDPELVLVLHDCWANPSVEATEQPQWPVLVKSCPFTGDNYLTQLIPPGVPSQSIPLPYHYKRFSISTFTFVDGRTQHALGGLVYFHCSASLCVPSTTDMCIPSCPSKKKRMIEQLNSGETVITSDGPVEFMVAEAASKTKGILYSNLSLNMARGTAAVAALLAGIVIMVIWVHHRRNSPKAYTVKA
uniref:Zona pellucida sperm-binding protein 4 n=1 Tax=Leptobrachium leishanense TaxID=445787 RepID=A0A8C5MQJ6_9ANUR